MTDQIFSSISELSKYIQTLILSEDVDGIIKTLKINTVKSGVVGPNKNINIWNYAGSTFLRTGKYKIAEKIYTEYYNTLCRLQKTLGRLHKGIPLHNMGISQCFQENTDFGIKHIILAFIEDVLHSSESEKVYKGGASSVLQGMCGVPFDYLSKIREIVQESSKIELYLDPINYYNNDLLSHIIKKIFNNYNEYLSEVWLWEKQAQNFYENGIYESSIEIYDNWYDTLLHYQENIDYRIHKGHPLFNSGQIRFIINLDDKKRSEGVNKVILSFIEDVITAQEPKGANYTASYRFLSSLGLSTYLQKIEDYIYREPITVSQRNPERIFDESEHISEKPIKMVSEDFNEIIQTKGRNEKRLNDALLKQKEISPDEDNKLLILKKWNSTSPRYPSDQDKKSIGGGYFFSWNGKGIVIDPGYDFLSNFFSKGYGISNIDLVIVSHAHNDHCQDLEVMLSLLYEYNGLEEVKEPHKIDLIISEGVQIKYERLFTIMKSIISCKVMIPSSKYDPTKSIDPSDLSNKNYQLTVFGCSVDHHERPWMENNTGFGLIFHLNKDGVQFKLGITGDTAFFKDLNVFYEECDVLIEHIGTVDESGNSKHLTHVGCYKLIEGLKSKPKMIILSEFGQELNGRRVTTCTGIESIINRGLIEEEIPVFAGDIKFEMKIDAMEILCSDTGEFVPYNLILDKEVDDDIIYVERE